METCVLPDFRQPVGGLFWSSMSTRRPQRMVTDIGYMPSCNSSGGSCAPRHHRTGLMTCCTARAQLFSSSTEEMQRATGGTFY